MVRPTGSSGWGTVDTLAIVRPRVHMNPCLFDRDLSRRAPASTKWTWVAGRVIKLVIRTRTDRAARDATTS